MNNEKYNGWNNYATWRVNFEVCDGMDKDAFENMSADAVQSYIQEIVFSDIPNGLAVGYALAFLDDVDWQELQEAYNGSDDE